MSSRGLGAFVPLVVCITSGCLGPEPQYGEGGGGAGSTTGAETSTTTSSTSTSTSSSSTGAGPGQGTPCDDEGDCGAFGGLTCADGVCCNDACIFDCDSCRDEYTGAGDGVCAPILRGTDPEFDCPSMQVCAGGIGSRTCVGEPGAGCNIDGECLSNDCQGQICT